MEVKEGYKRTELGVIPATWEVRRLSEVACLKSGEAITASSLDPSFAYPCFGGNGIRGHASRFTHDGSFALIGRQGALCGNVAGVSGRFFASEHAVVVTPRPGTSIEYLTYVLGRMRLNRLSEASAQPGLSVSKILQVSLAVPGTESEQKAIAEALSDVDDLIASLERLIAKKRDIKAATMGQLLTGSTRLPVFTGEWERKRLGEVGVCLRGVSYRGDNDLFPHDTPASKRLLRSNNVQDAAIVTAEVQFVRASCVSARQVLMRDDILICMANGSKALVGKAGRFKTEDGYAYTFGAFMGCFRTERGLAVPQFVFGLFLTEKYRGYIAQLLAGSSINNLRPSSVASLEFSMPPLPEQVAIAAVLSDMDAEIEALQARLDKTRMLKQGMMQELLTGRTRLV